MDKLNSPKHFLVIENNNNKRIINLESTTYSIGRAPDNLIVLNSPLVSRYHATLLRITTSGTESHQFRIIDGDLNCRRSRNGIRVNGKACFSYDLEHDDVITFCDNITARYQTVNAPKSAPTIESSFFLESDDDEDLETIASLNDSNNPSSNGLPDILNLPHEKRKATIQQSLERLASFPELFSDPIIEIDLKGNITYLNPAALKRFPSLKQEKLKHPMLVGIISLVKKAEKTSFIREVKIKNEIFEQSIHIISASQLVRCYVSDITKRKRAEILLKKAHKELEKRVKERTSELAHNNEILRLEIAERKQVEQKIRLLQTITQAITEASNFDEAIAITLRKVCETVGWSFGEAWIPDIQENVLKLSPAWYGSTEKLQYFRETSQNFVYPSDVGQPGRVWATKQPEWIEDVSVQSEQIFLRHKAGQAIGLRTALGVPMIANDEVIAVLIFLDFSAHTRNKKMLELVKSVAAQLGLIMERKRAEDALHSSMATNKAILNAIPDLILRVSRDGIFVNFKAAKNDNLLTPEKKFLGKHIYEVFPKEMSLSTMNCIERAFTTGEVQILECQIPDKDKLHSYEVRIAISEVDEVMAIVRNITERKQAEEDIRRTLEQEKKLNELKSRFVTMASHEFKTPLASILSSSELLENYSHKWSEEKKLSHLHRIQSSVKHMTELLNDILLLGKVEAGRLELKPTIVNLPKFCRELIEEVEPTTDTHQIIFQVQDDIEVNNTSGQQAGTVQNKYTNAYMDKKILRHIVHNLLSNAVKYSPNSDKVFLELICQSQQAVLQVQDFGIGIPLEDQKQLFDSFHRANNVGSIPGTGLGLSIVKRAVDLHEGTISVNSKMNQGTTFTVILPYLSVFTPLSDQLE